MTQLPILYSFRRCPFAMRARLGILHGGQKVDLREIILRDKAPQMLAASPKGTVPVLVLPDGQVIEQSREIMDWALGNSDPMPLADQIDADFKILLDRYKYPNRFENGITGRDARDASSPILTLLNETLEGQPNLSGDHAGYLDWAIAPFIRQFAHVDRDWFIASDYRALIDWYQRFIDSADFAAIMGKYPKWVAGDPVTSFPEAAHASKSNLPTAN